MPDTSARADETQPYRGLRVLDLGQGIASPYCGLLLALYGADVVKVEPPEGDWARQIGTTHGGHSALSAVYNRGKRALCVDLKEADGRQIVRELALRADILIEGFRPGVAARLGLGYDNLQTANPGLIYVSISGFGQSGPYTDRPATDSLAQAFAGLVAVNRGPDGTPHRVGVTVADISTGLYAFQAVATSLYARCATGKGRWLDISLTQSTAALLGYKLAEHVLEGGRPRPLNVPGGIYQTQDDFIMIALATEDQYQRLCKIIGHPGLAHDPRFTDFTRRADNTSQLMPLIGDSLRQETTAVWLERFIAGDIIATRVLDPREWMRDPHVIATHGVVSVETPDIGKVYVPCTPGVAPGDDSNLPPAPLIGQHSREVLREAGVGDAEIARLVATSVVRLAGET